jgi:electron transfer flavoprotein alpha subunit
LRDLIYNGIWIFGDHRNYFQDRVTLQLINRSRELANSINTYVGVVLIGDRVDEYILEYTAHGADKIFLIENKRLKNYSSDLYTSILVDLIENYKPEILLISGSDFGREIAPRVAARLRTGISSDCISLQINDKGNLVQISPSYQGNSLAEIITPECRPQIATVRPGVFSEQKHNYHAQAELIRIDIDIEKYDERVKIKTTGRIESQDTDLENADYVVCVGRGYSKRDNIKKARELAKLMDAEISGTRPVLEKNLLSDDRLIGQTGKTVKPQLLLVLGASGAVQFTASITNSDCIVAVNRDPNAAIFKYCDIGIVGDAGSIVNRLLKELKK